MKTPKFFHQYKTQFDYYRTSKVIDKIFGNEKLDINDKINFRSMYRKGVSVIFNQTEHKTICY